MVWLLVTVRMVPGERGRGGEGERGRGGAAKGVRERKYKVEEASE